jgi:hypothetical protein
MMEENGPFPLPGHPGSKRTGLQIEHYFNVK